MVLPGTASAKDWSGATDNNWFDPNNWANTAGVPTAGDALLIQAGGTAVIDGAVANGTPAATAVMNVGDTSVGTVQILNAGVLNMGLASLGTTVVGDGTVSVGGANSQWNLGGALRVGDGGKGTVMVTGGAAVTSLQGRIGMQAGSTGTVTVDGAGGASSWSSGALKVGIAGKGTLDILNGGTVQSNGAVIGELGFGKGFVTVDASTWSNQGTLSVGEVGTGTLTITGGASVGNTSATIGSGAAGIGGLGTVKVDGNNSVWNNTGLVIGNGGVGVLTISNAGTVSSQSQVVITNTAFSEGTINIGAAIAAPAAMPGILTAPGGVQFGDGIGTINFNHADTSGNYVFGADLSGAAGKGTLVHAAGFTKLTGNSAGFSGQTSITGGRLAVNGMLGSLVVVSNGSGVPGGGGILGGAGTVGGIQANAGGIVAPGNSIGTLTVTGNATFNTGSIFRVEVDAAGNTDKLAVAGAAALNGGTVEVKALLPDNYAASRSYTILTAGGGVTGKFAGVTDDAAFLESSLNYADPSKVDLTLTRNDTPFGGVGQTPGQTSTGTGAETLGPDSPVYKALVVLSAPQARAAFDQLSGEIHTSARSVQLQDSHFMRDASLERLRAMDSENPANDGGADAGDGKPARLLPSVRDIAYWARAMGSWGHMAGEGNAATVKRDTAGFLMGADTRFGEQGRLGLTGGYSRSAFDVSERASSGSSDNYHLGAYAGSRFGDLALRTGVSYSWHDVSTSRTVAFPGFTDNLKADYKAATTQAFAELGYRIKAQRAELEPFVNLAHVNVSSDGFTERGGPAALASSGSSSGVTFSTLGLRASTKVDLAGGADVTARGMLGYRHAFGDTTPGASLAFSGGLPFASAGAPIAKGATVVEAGLDFKLTNAATLGFSYGGQFGSGLRDQSAKVNLNVAF